MQGLIQPEVPEGTQASVFAVFDEGKKLQFVGFSKDLRNSLRTVFSRRPDKAFFYKCAPVNTWKSVHCTAGQLKNPGTELLNLYASATHRRLCCIARWPDCVTLRTARQFTCPLRCLYESLTIAPLCFKEGAHLPCHAAGQ